MNTVTSIVPSLLNLFLSVIDCIIPVDGWKDDCLSLVTINKRRKQFYVGQLS